MNWFVSDKKNEEPVWELFSTLENMFGNSLTENMF